MSTALFGLSKILRRSGKYAEADKIHRRATGVFVDRQKGTDQKAVHLKLHREKGMYKSPTTTITSTSTKSAVAVSEKVLVP